MLLYFKETIIFSDMNICLFDVFSNGFLMKPPAINSVYELNEFYDLNVEVLNAIITISPACKGVK